MSEPPPQFDYRQPPNVSAPPQGSFATGICPSCGNQARKVTYTWWGGVIGAALVPHYKCPACKASFSSKDGQPVTRQIVIYMTLALVIPFVIFFFLYLSGAILKH